MRHWAGAIVALVLATPAMADPGGIWQCTPVMGQAKTCTNLNCRDNRELQYRLDWKKKTLQFFGQKPVRMTLVTRGNTTSATAVQGVPYFIMAADDTKSSLLVSGVMPGSSGPITLWGHSLTKCQTVTAAAAWSGEGQTGRTP